MTLGPVKMDGGTEEVMRPGECFYVPPGHDSWVVGDEPYASLHIMLEIGSPGFTVVPSRRRAPSTRCSTPR